MEIMENQTNNIELFKIQENQMKCSNHGESKKTPKLWRHVKIIENNIKSRTTIEIYQNHWISNRKP